MNTLRDDSTRAACLKALRDAIDAELEVTRDDVTDAMTKVHAELGIRSGVDVELPDGTVIGKISYQPGGEKPEVTDEGGLVDYVAERYPSEVTRAVRSTFRKQLVDRLEVFDGKVVDTATGEPVDWAAPAPKAPGIRLNFGKGGRAAVAAAWRERQLDGVFGGVLALEGGDNGQRKDAA